MIRNKSVVNKSIVNNNIINKRIMNKSIINRSMIIKSNTIFFIYTIVINDSKVFINKRESLRYLGLFSLAPLSSLRGRRAHSLPFWWSSISTVSWCWPDIMRLQRCIKVSSFINFLSWYIQFIFYIQSISD